MEELEKVEHIKVIGPDGKEYPAVWIDYEEDGHVASRLFVDAQISTTYNLILQEIHKVLKSYLTYGSNE